MSEPITQIVNKITDALRSRKETEITGALLGELIRDEIPGINIREIVSVPAGAGALSKFIELHLSGFLKRDRKSGADWIYKIQDHQPSNSLDVDESSWSAFVDTKGSRVLLLDRENLSLLVKNLDECKKDTTLVQIPSLTQQELGSIQNKFTSTISDHELKEELSRFTPEQYSQWTSALRKSLPAKLRKWSKFRRDEIAKIFAGRLESAGLEQTHRDRLVQAFIDSQTIAHIHKKERLSSRHKDTPPDLGALSSLGDADHNFKATLIKVLSNMTVEELRDLRVPFGKMYDAINKS